MDFTFTEEQEMFREMVRDFAQKEVLPLAETLDREERPPLETLKKAARLDLFGILFPEKYGGVDAGIITYCIMMEELGKVCSATAGTIGVDVGVGAMAIYLDGTEEQKQKYLMPLAKGEKLAAFALTEPNAGSDAASITTSAVRDGDHYVLNGSKTWITNGDIADFIITFAVTSKGSGARGISAFIVEKDFPGFKVGWREKKMGLRGTSTCQLFYDDCCVPTANLLGGRPGLGFLTAMRTLDFGRLSIGASCLGGAQAALKASIEFASQRQQFGGPIANKQAIQFLIADMATEIESLRHMVYHAAWLAEMGKKYSREAAMCKLWGSQVLVRAVNKAVQVHGGMGYMKRFPIERYYRDARITEIFEGTNEIQRFVIASDLFKEVGVRLMP